MQQLTNPALVVTVFLSAVLSIAQTTGASGGLRSDCAGKAGPGRPAPTGASAPQSDQSATNIPLTIAPGVPLRLYITKRLTKRMGEPVHAKLLEPVFAFDREVIPAGVEVEGKVVRLDPDSKMKRAAALLGGDFTPLHMANVQFTTIVLKDGRQIALNTRETIGLNSIVDMSPPKKPKKTKPANPASTSGGGVWDATKQQAKQQAKDEINRQINARTRGVADLVRGPDKKERLQEFLLTKLPYHPQWVRKGTRFDAELLAPLEFGSASFVPAAFKLVGTQPPADSIVHARLITPLNSADAKQGEKVEAILSQPLFSADNQLILPEGTHLVGTVTQVHAAQWFKRGGQLRFSFQNIALPLGIDAPVVQKTQARLQAAEAGGKDAIAVDDEGGVKVKEPKTRFIAPAISVLIASKSLDNDAGRTGTTQGNAGGRTLGGLSGFGAVGGLAAQSSKIVGSVLGVYGMAWSVYANIVSRGGEVEFENNAAVDIRFGSRAPVGAAKLRAEAAARGTAAKTEAQQ